MSKAHPDISKRLKSSLKSYKRLTKSVSQRKQARTSKNGYVPSCNSTKLSVMCNPSDASHLFPIVSLLERLNYNYEVMPDSQIKESCFFIQDKFMSTFYGYYPEYICFDVLCEIPEVDHTLALFIGLDSNGHCEIVSAGLIKSGSLEGYAWFCDVFKKHNDFWNKIEFIICNHSVDVREMLTKAFPHKLIFFSFFHSIKNFKKDISCLNSMLTSTDISKALHIFEQMFFVSTELGYTELLKQIKQISPHIFSLFKKNWHSKRELWALGLQFDSRMFLKAFNGFLLNLRRKLKPLINSAELLQSVIERLHFAIVKVRREWFQKFTCIFQPPIVSYYSKLRVVKKYSMYLTPYATELIIEQLNMAENIRNIQKVDQYTYKVNGIQTLVSFNTCFCNFHTLMMLPCCHIFVIRNYLSLPLFVDSLRTSWLATKYKIKFLDLYSLFTSEKVGFVSSEQSERFNQCIHMSHEFWNLLLHCNDEVSQQRLEVFRNLLKAWKSNFRIGIQIFPKQNNSSSSIVESLEKSPTDYFNDMYGISLNDILDSENDFSSVSLCSENENEFL